MLDQLGHAVAALGADREHLPVDAQSAAADRVNAAVEQVELVHRGDRGNAGVADRVRDESVAGADLLVGR